jgi:hypothetical protein
MSLARWMPWQRLRFPGNGQKVRTNALSRFAIVFDRFKGTQRRHLLAQACAVGGSERGFFPKTA